MKTLLLIDGNGLIHRAYHALPPFKTKSGIPTNAIYGFMNMLYRMISDFKPDYIIVCFDTPKPTFRKELFKEYQAHRPKVDGDFITQLPYIREMLEKAGIIYMQKEGYEADDVIGTFAEKFKTDYRVLILSSDKDILQLVNKNVFVISPKVGISKFTVYNEDEVKGKFGIDPPQIADLKALAGDPSDNYTGAKGIGPKTAVKLILEYGTTENLLTHIDQIKEEKLKTLLQTYKDNIILSKQLSTIHKEVPVECDIETTRFTGFNKDLGEFLEKLEINSLKERIFNPKLEKKGTPEKETKLKKVKGEILDDQIDLFS